MAELQDLINQSIRGALQELHLQWRVVKVEYDVVTQDTPHTIKAIVEFDTQRVENDRFLTVSIESPRRGSDIETKEALMNRSIQAILGAGESRQCGHLQERGLKGMRFINGYNVLVCPDCF